MSQINLKDKIDLKGLKINEIIDCFSKYDVPAFRAKQVFQWINQKHVVNFELMTNLSKTFRSFLEENFIINVISINSKLISSDGTIKYMFELADRNKIETVLLPPLSVNKTEKWINNEIDLNRLTLCVSTQIGCPLKCKFCATGYMDFKRDLTTAEIVDQIIQAQIESGKKITNIVFMGMGEPLLNYEAVMSAIEILNDENGLAIPNKHITISTAGIIPKILQLADEKKKTKLAVSLNSLNNDIRSLLMPLNKKYPLSELIKSVQYYYKKTKIRPTFEYILFNKLNDNEADFKNIVKLSKTIPCKFNIINFHQSEFFDSDLEQSNSFDLFVTKLRKENVTVMVRNSSGKDISAACGQLAIKKN
jgi:23S rRNA (adenine2503-C2)-methyltransferase